MSASDLEIWGIILALGIGSFVIRFSFLGLLAGRQMPAWVLRHLRYTPAAVLPGLVAPLIIWPDTPDGATDPVRLAAAATTLAIGVWIRSTNWAVLAGGVVLLTGQLLL